MINNVVLVSVVQQSDSVIHIQVSILFPIIFPFRFLKELSYKTETLTDLENKLMVTRGRGGGREG